MSALVFTPRKTGSMHQLCGWPNHGNRSGKGRYRVHMASWPLMDGSEPMYVCQSCRDEIARDWANAANEARELCAA